MIHKFYFIFLYRIKKNSKNAFFWQFFKKLNMELPYDIARPLLGIYPKGPRPRPHRDLGASGHGSVIQNNQKVETTQPEFCSAIKRSEALTHGTMWTNVEKLCQVEEAGHSKTTRCEVSRICRDRKWAGGGRDWGGKQGVITSAFRVSSGGMKMSWNV